jgi:phosphoglucomutase
MMAELRGKLGTLPGTAFGALIVAASDDFAYLDPVDGSTSNQQGIRILFEGGSRIVFRLSGTGTSGATIRVYIERYEPVGGDLAQATPDAIADLVGTVEAIAGITRHTGRTEPDVIT